MKTNVCCLLCHLAVINAYFIATPPYIPNLSGPDDTSHFEQIKPRPGASVFYKPSRPQYGFNGQSLQFVGFTHSKFPSITCDHHHPVAAVRCVSLFYIVWACVCVCVLLYAYVCVC